MPWVIPPRRCTNGGVPYNADHPHVEWSHAFNDIARDYENEVVILTGAGDIFIGEHEPPPPYDRSDGDGNTGAALVGKVPPRDPNYWDHPYQNGKFIMMNLLSIECPVIGVVNGPALTHAELAVLSDIVLCSDTAVFQDQPHFEAGLYAPGDGVALVWPLVLGINRGRYFLLTGQKIDAQQARELGVVNEVLPRGELLPRAYAIASEILKRPKLVRRYSRVLLTQSLKQAMLDHVGYGLALEGLGVAARHLDSEFDG